MTPQHVIAQLLDSDTKYSQNLIFLKKIILTSYYGRLRINGLAPDNKIALGNYLFDNERMIIDFTRLSSDKKKLFLQWLLEPHQNEKEISYLTGVYVNEDRGFTSETILSWWAWLFNWFLGRFSENWKISDLEFSLNYQMTGIQLCHGDEGILVGFDQYLVPPTSSKYKDPNDPQLEPLGNTKRVYITDHLVDHLVNLNLKEVQSVSICKKPHPQAMPVLDPLKRFEEMNDYRTMHQFNDEKTWYQRAWSTCTAWMNQEKVSQPVKRIDKDLTLLYQNSTVTIYQRVLSREIIVREKKPEIENLVLCGGGPKIFTHVGVWQALNEAKIKPIRFAGSSSGAIMSLMCYLGYNSEEIAKLFRYFRHEHLVQYDINFKGLSDSHSLKTALDFAIVNKLNQISKKYRISFPKDKITFSTLEAIRQQFPDCGFGQELVVTGTNKRLRKITYFSLKNTPEMEVSEAVTTSALFPVVYKEKVIMGDEYNDGGVLNNFPTEVFCDDHSTLLESEYGNNLKILAVQFDNGTERSAIDKIKEQVYRENFVLNALYSIVTGVSDPASAWERDRRKLRQYAHQTIVPFAQAPTSGFTVEDENQKIMFRSGYEATKDYLDIRYGSKEENSHVNQEFMYSTFSSLGDLLAFCCYRGDYEWFCIINDLIAQSILPNRMALMKQSLELKNLYFRNESNKAMTKTQLPSNDSELIEQEEQSKHQVFLSLYPIFLRLTPDLVLEKTDKLVLINARHSLRLYEPFNCLEFLNQLKGEKHILIQALIHLIKELKVNPSEEFFDKLKVIKHLLQAKVNLNRSEYYGVWNISAAQGWEVLMALNNGNYDLASQYCNDLSVNSSHKVGNKLVCEVRTEEQKISFNM